MTYYVVIDTNVLVSAALKHDSVPMAGKMIIHATKHVLALADIKHILRLVEYDIYPCEIIPPGDMSSSAPPIARIPYLEELLWRDFQGVIRQHLHFLFDT